MEKIKISFDLIDTWNREEFRNLIYNIKNGLYNKCDFEYELWIITTNDNSAFVYTISDQLEIPDSRVILCADNSTKVGQIALNSDIHLDIDQVIVTALIPTTVAGILVDNKVAYNKIGLKYIADINKWTDAILRERSGGEKIKPC